MSPVTSVGRDRVGNKRLERRRRLPSEMDTQMDDAHASEMAEAPRSVRDVPIRSVQDARESDKAEREKRLEGIDRSLGGVQEADPDRVLPPLTRSNAKAMATHQRPEMEVERPSRLEIDNCHLREQLAKQQESLEELARREKDTNGTNFKIMSDQRKQISDLKIDERKASEQLYSVSMRFNDLLETKQSDREHWATQERALKDQVSKLSRHIEEWDVSVQSLRSECERLRSVEKEKNRQIQELGEKIKDHAATISRQEDLIETSVTRYQMAAVSMLSQSVSTSLPDDLIKREFEGIFEEVVTWARANATTGPLDIDSPQLQSLDGHLWKRFEVRESGPDFNFDFKNSTAADTLLNAALAKDLCQTFLKVPFFFAEHTHPIMSSKTADDERLRTDRALDRVYSKMLKHEADTAVAHAWRAVTVQTLSQTSGAQENIEKFYREAANDFLETYPFLMKPNLVTEEKESLIESFRTFGNFALRLWSHKYDVGYRTLHKFQDRLFLSSAPDMSAADAVRLEEGDKGLDGRPIAVVLQPLIEGFGTPDGKDYGRRKIWSKAKVWVSSDRSGEAAGERPGH